MHLAYLKLPQQGFGPRSSHAQCSNVLKLQSHISIIKSNVGFGKIGEYPLVTLTSFGCQNHHITHINLWDFKSYISIKYIIAEKHETEFYNLLPPYKHVILGKLITHLSHCTLLKYITEAISIRHTLSTRGFH